MQLGFQPHKSFRDRDELIPSDIKLDIPPLWVELVDRVKRDLEDADMEMRSLTEQHSRHIKEFDTNRERELEHAIQASTANITRLIRKSDANIKKISSLEEGEEGGRTAEDASIRLNAQRSLAIKLQETSSHFRDIQKSYMGKLKGRERRELEEASWATGLNMRDVDETPVGMSQMDAGFSRDQMRRMQFNEELIEERSRDIDRLLASVNELSEIFKEMSILVIEQGSILDRIDYNIEQVEKYTELAEKQIGKAESYQKSYRMKLFILILLVLVIAMVLIVILKAFMGKNNTTGIGAGWSNGLTGGGGSSASTA